MGGPLSTFLFVIFLPLGRLCGGKTLHSKCFREGRLWGKRDPNYVLTRVFDGAVLRDPHAASLLLISECMLLQERSLVYVTSE